MEVPEEEKKRGAEVESWLQGGSRGNLLLLFWPGAATQCMWLNA